MRTRTVVVSLVIGALLALPASARYGSGGNRTGNSQQGSRMGNTATGQGIPQSRGTVPQYRSMNEKGYSTNSDGHIVNQSGNVVRDAAGNPIVPRNGYQRQPQQ